MCTSKFRVHFKSGVRSQKRFRGQKHALREESGNELHSERLHALKTNFYSKQYFLKLLRRLVRTVRRFRLPERAHLREEAELPLELGR